MIEVAAEANDTLMHKYLEGEQLSDKEIRAGLRERSIRNEIVLCMCGTAFKNKGVQALLDAVIEFMPSPIEMRTSRASTTTASRDAQGERRGAVLRARFKILNDRSSAT